MNYRDRLFKLAEENLSDNAFKLWSGINKILPDIWDKPSSSTGKWHRKMNGEVPSQAEHVYHLLYAAIKLIRMFDYDKKTGDSDKILLGVLLHDSLKYGTLGTRKHTDSKHDKESADMISVNKNTFLKILNEKQFYELEEMVRFHSGQWSTDKPKDKKFSFRDLNPETLLIHILDMMSTADLIQTDVRE